MEKSTKTRGGAVFLARVGLGAALALGAWAAAAWLWGPLTFRTEARPRLPEIAADDADHIIQAKSGPSGDLFIRREAGFERRDAGGALLWSGLSMESLSGQRPLVPYEFAATRSGDLLVLGLLEGTREMALYRVTGSPPRVAALGIFPQMAPADVAIDPQGKVFLLAVATPLLNEALLQDRKTASPIEEPLIHELDGGGKIRRSFFVRQYSAHSREETVAEVAAFQDQRLAVSPDGSLYLYSLTTADVTRIDPASGEPTGTSSLSWAGFPARVRLTGLEFIDDRQALYSLVEMNADGMVQGFQSWQIDLQGGQRRMVQRSMDPSQAIWQASFDPVRRQVKLMDILGHGRQGVRTLDFEDLPRPAREIH